MSILDLTNENQLNELTQQYKYVIIKFSAEWCNPCKRIQPFYEKKSLEYSNICFTHVDVDLESVRNLCDNYNVEGMPTFLLLQNNNEIYRFSGAKEQELENMLKLCVF